MPPLARKASQIENVTYRCHFPFPIVSGVLYGAVSICALTPPPAPLRCGPWLENEHGSLLARSTRMSNLSGWRRGEDMRFMLAGYGNGSRDGDGTAKQYKTLRGVIVSEKMQVQKGGVRVGKVSVPSIKLPAVTRKVSKESYDNLADLHFHSMSADEALQVSCAFAEYALLVGDQTTKAAVKFSNERANQAAGQFLKVLLASERDAGMVPFMRELVGRWTKDSELDTKVADIQAGYGHKESAAILKRKGEWRGACATKLSELLEAYQRGPEPTSPANSRPHLTLVSNNPETGSS